MSDEVDGQENEGQPATRGPVPYERFAEVNAKARAAAKVADELRARVAALEGEIGTHKTAAEAVTGELAQLRDRYDLHRAGIDDDDGAEVARLLFGKIPADQRPKGGLVEWIGTMRADPAKTPKPLAPYLAGQATAEAPAKRPAENAGATGRQPEGVTADKATAEQIRAHRELFQRQGRLSELAKDPTWIRLTGRR